MREAHHTIAFFGDTQGQGSFYRTNESLLRAFRHAGANVYVHGRYDPLNKGSEADLAFVHPGWSAGGFFGVNGVRRRYGAVALMDVLNYSGVGPKVRAVLESGTFDIACISGAHVERHQSMSPTRILDWPQGVSADFSPKTYPIPNFYDRKWAPRILLEGFNPSLLRKGHDLHARVLKELQAQGRKFEVVLHAPLTREVKQTFAGVKGIRLVPSYMTRDAQRRLWDRCDILLHLNRGGGFELQPMEAASRGLIPVIPAADPMLRYAADGAFFVIPTKRWKMTAEQWKRWNVGLDAGTGYEADVDGAVAALNDILEGFEQFRLVSIMAAQHFYDTWSFDRVIRENLARLFATVEELHKSGRRAEPRTI